MECPFRVQKIIGEMTKMSQLDKISDSMKQALVELTLQGWSCKGEDIRDNCYWHGDCPYPHSNRIIYNLADTLEVRNPCTIHLKEYLENGWKEV
jgi:hypothetical protein